MRSIQAQELVRELITETDALSRVCYQANDTTGSGRLAALRSTLQRIERRLGGDAPMLALEGELDLVYQRVRDLSSRSGGHSDELGRLLAHAASLRMGRPKIGTTASIVAARVTASDRPFELDARSAASPKPVEIGGRPGGGRTRHAQGSHAVALAATLAALAGIVFSVTMSAKLLRGAR